MHSRHHWLLAVLFAFTGLFAAGSAGAWWNEDWKDRTRVTLDTSDKGVRTQGSLNNVPVAIRLHSGNFNFGGVRDDGADLRVVAGDDKTPLAFGIERFDAINELAVLWVQVPLVAPDSAANALYIYSGNANAAAEPAQNGFDAATLAAVHFSDREGVAVSHNGALQSAARVPVEDAGLLAASARLDGNAIVWPGSEAVRIAADQAATVTLWIRPDSVALGTVLQWGPVTVSLQDGKAVARIGTTELAGGAVAPAAWTQVGLTLGGGTATLYLNGEAVATAAVATPAVDGELRVGQDLTGLADELQVSAAARPADWMRVSYAAQGTDGRLVVAAMDSADAAAGVGGSHFGILVQNLTVDAWVVIAILAVMFAIAAWVMVSKALLILRDEKANRAFLARYRSAGGDLLSLHKGARQTDSSLFRLYEAGIRELEKRDVGKDGRALSGAAINAVKSAVDADMVRETQRLNAQMVLLTIAISGGPFLGLLGTVVGVMITFAAIAAAGDVNVNAIAPGIAAALLATVAGLAVAIPALFGYNYLASRIKNISTGMQIFVDEFITRVAELYGR